MPRYFKRDRKYDGQNYPFPTWQEISKAEAKNIDASSIERVIEVPTPTEIYEEVIQILNEHDSDQPIVQAIKYDLDGDTSVASSYFRENTNSDDNLAQTYIFTILRHIFQVEKDSPLQQVLRIFCADRLGLVLPMDLDGTEFVIKYTDDFSKLAGEISAKNLSSMEVEEPHDEVPSPPPSIAPLFPSGYELVTPEITNGSDDYPIDPKTSSDKDSEIVRLSYFQGSDQKPKKIIPKKTIEIVATDRYCAITDFSTSNLKRLFPQSLIELLQTEILGEEEILINAGPLARTVFQKAIQNKIANYLLSEELEKVEPIIANILSLPPDERRSIVDKLFEHIAILIAHTKDEILHYKYMSGLSYVFSLFDPQEKYFARIKEKEDVIIVFPQAANMIIEELRQKGRIPKDFVILMARDADKLESIIKEQLKIHKRFAIIFFPEKSHGHYTPIWVQRSEVNKDHFDIIVTDSIGFKIPERMASAVDKKTPPSMLTTMKTIDEEGKLLSASLFASFEENFKRMARKGNCTLYIHTQARQADGMNCFTMAIRDIIELAKLDNPVEDVREINQLSDLTPGFHFIKHVPITLFKTTQIIRTITEFLADNPTLRDQKLITRKTPTGETIDTILARKKAEREIRDKDDMTHTKSINIRLEMRGIKYLGIAINALLNLPKLKDGNQRFAPIEDSKEVILHFMGRGGVLSFCSMICVIQGVPFFKAITISPKFGTPKRPATFFPFMGVITQDKELSSSIILGTGSYIKAYGPGEIALEKRFPKLLLEFITAYQKHDLAKQGIDYYDEIARFGNFQYMIISMLLGGGIWENEQGKCLKAFIMNFFSKYVEESEQLFKKDIEKIREIIASEDKLELKYLPTASTSHPLAENIVTTSRTVPIFLLGPVEVFDHDEFDKINQFLLAKGCDKDRIGSINDLDFELKSMPIPEKDTSTITEFLNDYAKHMVSSTEPKLWR